jgi:hypothetical protein
MKTMATIAFCVMAMSGCDTKYQDTKTYGPPCENVNNTYTRFGEEVIYKACLSDLNDRLKKLEKELGK